MMGLANRSRPNWTERSRSAAVMLIWSNVTSQRPSGNERGSNDPKRPSLQSQTDRLRNVPASGYTTIR